MLNSQEQKRIKVLNDHLMGNLSVSQVGEVMKCSERQVYRWKASYRAKGVEAMAHGNRGKRSSKRIGEERRMEIVEKAITTYAGCNQSHLRDLLEEREGISISRASVRRILAEAGRSQPSGRKRPKHRLRRARYRQEGQMIQVDGSPHDWLGERGPRMTLIGGIDDATGKVVGAIFRKNEDQEGYFEMLRQVVEEAGVPQAIYHDRHQMFPEGKYHATEKGTVEEQLAGKRKETQLGRLFEHLGITSIAARSPQAKGRVERLWGTLQDRLMRELAIAGITTMAEANAFLKEFLPRYNARFAVPATSSLLGWQEVPSGIILDEEFCLHGSRRVASDNTISYQGKKIQILPTTERGSFAQVQVSVHEHFDGQISLWWQGVSLPCRLAPADAAGIRAQSQGPANALPSKEQLALLALRESKAKAEPKPPRKPAPTHPWRRPRLTS